MSNTLNVHWRTFHRLCQPLKKRNKAIYDVWIDIQTFYQQDNVSFEMPIAQASGRQFLTKTLEESYHIYKEDCNKSDKKGMAFSTFCHLRPKNIYKISQKPDRQCICDQCENFCLLRQAFQYNQIKGIPSHTNLCIKQSMCEVNNNESNAEWLASG